jgi:hypothetical protein
MAVLDGEGRVLARATSNDGEVVAWARKELRPSPRPFPVEAVRAWEYEGRFHSDESGRTDFVDVSLDVAGMPGDVLFLELDRGAFSLTSGGGNTGTLVQMVEQYRIDSDWRIRLRISGLPKGDRIRSLRLSLECHQATRVARHVAVVGAGQAAWFDFGEWAERWVVSGPTTITVFGRAVHGSPIAPLYGVGLAPRDTTRIEDADGKEYASMGEDRTGHQSVHLLGLPLDESARLPVTITVDIPLETRTTRVTVDIPEFRHR